MEVLNVKRKQPITNQKIKFLDLSYYYKQYKQQIDNSLSDILSSGLFLNGKYLDGFEKDFADYCEREFCVGTANGLDALTIALMSLDIKAGDEVIVPAHTFIATFLAVSRVGATPIIVDIDPDSFNISSSLITQNITKKTKAIIGVHLYGMPCDVESIQKICKEHSLYFIEDAAQAHGALYKNKKVGSFGDIGCFSFYPGKNLGAAGDGGALVTGSETIATKARKIANYGSTAKYQHDIIGINSRLDEIHAAILKIKLADLDRVNTHRNNLAQLYVNELKNIKEIILPKTSKNYYSVFHLFVIRTQKRDELQSFLKTHSIESLIHYPIPPHLTKTYKELNHYKFPTTEKICNEVLSLPIGPHLSTEDVLHICEKIQLFFL